MLTEKQNIFFKNIINYYNNTNELPTISDLIKINNYKSYNTIYKYLNQLENKNYIIYDKNHKRIIYIKDILDNESFFKVPFINEKRFINIDKNLLKSKEEYLAFQIHDNKLNSNNIENKDILIIQKGKKNINNKLVLVFKNSKYNIYKYQNQNTYLKLFNDKEELFLESSNHIIGKVVLIIRNK